MDNSQYQSNTMSTSNAQYNALPGMISPHQLQQQNLPPHTLPPLQPQHAALHSLYGSAPHTPRTPATPNTPSSANTTSTYPQMGTQSRNYQMMPANNYQQQQVQPYRNTTVNMPQSIAPMQQQQQQQQHQPPPQPIAPAPTQNRMQQPLRPMPQSSQQMMSPLSVPYSQESMLAQAPVLSENEQPTHVVGSQGRRGILPSAPGRPAVPATGPGASKSTLIPAKDADGKFPCPHCTKTYLHAKHLKRHLLRHTGDRPYMCVLCRDTFSRSDILKRHFQKCSIRRGNPTGASHLSHAQAHVKKSHPSSHRSTPSTSNESNLMGVNGVNTMNHESPMTFQVVAESNNPGSNINEPAQDLSRNNSIKRGSIDSRTVTAQNATRSSMDQGYTTGMPSSLSTAMNTAMAYSMPNGQNNASYGGSYDFSAQNNNNHMHAQSHDTNPQSAGRAAMPVYASSNQGQQQGGVDWAHVFQTGAQPHGQSNFINSYGGGMTEAQMHNIKAEKH